MDSSGSRESSPIVFNQVTKQKFAIRMSRNDMNFLPCYVSDLFILAWHTLYIYNHLLQAIKNCYIIRFNADKIPQLNCKLHKWWQNPASLTILISIADAYKLR